ncbi:Beta-galactosidase 3 [Streptococcus sp. DD10]|uniref:glycoside hydrolase family 35 protein n=1 Tax=Streptococcus sp. DD10 TaxID=1777878 RepID=UPI000796959E|nr:glycoside hydrolase family 35 protein [Streptococcus sp. DD10]KXT72669.1 Beta-galactosidase 3 [Streptococcus sp. DD10]
MARFEIKEDFYLDQQPFKILSGAIHYFRVHPEDWYHSLYNLKALGFNTVETYVPWNLHEPKEGKFNFKGIADVERFLKIAQDLGLYAIVRPSPYICAEWEFGGLPAWLLEKKEMRIRSSDSQFLACIEHYYEQLLPRLAPFELENGGNILMMQVENEYGSYGEDKTYLRAVKRLMRRAGIRCPLFTSDGPWRATLRAGSMIEDDIFTTGNFGSKADYNFSQMQEFFDEHGKKWPLMCMEFWDGWFNRWKEPIIRRDGEELAEAIHEVLKRGSINLYMFHGGTNFGFMNGCSARGTTDLPQVTSYDYDALLNEQGNPTAKYFAVKQMIATHYPDYPQLEPLVKESIETSACLVDKVSLFETVDSIAKPIESLYPLSATELGQGYGYTLYQVEDTWDADEERLRVIDARDRMQLYLNGHLQATQYQTEIGEDIFCKAKKKALAHIDILIENMGRVNYGHKLLADTQTKGIRQGVCKDLHFMLGWKQYALELDTLDGLDFSKEWKEGQPAFYRYHLQLDRVKDSFIDLSGFGKGVVFVNGVNIGRFWDVGPTLSLYVPHGLLKEGENEMIVFETEGRYQETLPLVSQPIFKIIKGENL